MKTPFLVAENIYLRTLSAEDLTERYRDWFNDAEVCRYNSHHRFPNYDEDMRRYYETTIQSHENLILAICDKSTDAHVGNVGLQGIDLLNQSAEFAILIGDKSYWNRGVGKEVMRLIIAHGFSQLNLQRIYCGTAENNAGMQKLALALGFREEGRSRQALYKDGEFRDLVHYGLLRSEYDPEGGR